MIELRIYLKEKKKPLILLLDTEKQLNDFYEELETHDIVKFGQVIFRRDEFLYCTMEV